MAKLTVPSREILDFRPLTWVNMPPLPDDQDDKSRVTGDCYASLCGSRRVRPPPATRHDGSTLRVKCRRDDLGRGNRRVDTCQPRGSRWSLRLARKQRLDSTCDRLGEHRHDADPRRSQPPTRTMPRRISTVTAPMDSSGRTSTSSPRMAPTTPTLSSSPAVDDVFRNVVQGV
jgi:hypothetical protein